MDEAVERIADEVLANVFHHLLPEDELQGPVMYPYTVRTLKRFNDFDQL